MATASPTALTTWAFLDHLQEGVVIVDAGGSLLYSNEAARQLLGLNKEVYSLAEIYSLVAPDEMWQHLLTAPSEAYLYTEQGRVHLQAKTIRSDDEEYIQINIAPSQWAEQSIDPTLAGEQLATLFRISQQLNVTLRLENVLQAVTEEALRITNAQGCVVSLRDRASDQFIPQIQQGQITTSLQREYLDEVIESRQSKIFRELNVRNGHTLPSVLVTPILYEGAVAGLMSLFGRRRRQFDDQTVTFITALANHASIAIGNTQRFSELEERNILLHQRAQQIERLVESSRVFHGDRPLDEVYEDLVYAIQEGVGYGVVLLSLIDEDDPGQNLRRITAAGLPLARLRELQEIQQPWRVVEALMQPEFELGAAYFVPTENSPEQRKDVHTLQVEEFLPMSPVDGDLDDNQWRSHDLFFIPLIGSRGQPLGLISLDAPNENKRPDANTAKTLEIFANQAAIAIENIRLLHNTRNFANMLQQLHNVSQQVLREQSFDQQLRLIVEGLQATGWQQVALTLRDSELKSIRLITAGCDEEAEKALAEDKQDAAMWRKLIANDALKEFQYGSCYFLPGDDPTVRKIRGLPAQSTPLPADKQTLWQPDDLLFLPLLDRQQEVMAIVKLDHPVDKRRPASRALQTVDLYAQFATSVIENARLVNALRELNEQLDERVAQRTQALGEERDRVQILLRITTELASSLDQHHILNRTLQLVNEVVNAGHGGIILSDPESGQMRYHASFGSPPNHNLNHEESLATWVLQNRSSQIIQENAAASQSRQAWAELKDSQDNRSILAVPLTTGEDTLGVLTLFHQKTNAFSDEQIALVEAAAAQAANAIYNAQLYLLIRDQAERLGKMLREEQIEAAKSEAILQSIADGVLVADAKGEVILANMPASLILDIPRQQLLDKPITELLGLYGDFGESWAKAINSWSQMADHARQHRSLVDRLTIEDKVISIHLSPVFANNQFMGTVSIFRDITKEVEVDRMKSEFVSTVSHELRTPMTSIKGYADLMLMNVAGAMSDQQRRYLKIIKNNADRLSMLVNDLLDISRIETGKTELELKPIDVSQIVQQVVDGHLRGRIQHEEKPIEVITEIAPSLPLVNADHARLTQILTNLLDNAFHYTPDNGCITVSVAANGDSVAISIADTGIGIAEENLNKIFDRFFRASDDDVQRVAGTGLGLAIVRSLVEMHDGKINVESEVGQGSVFTIHLPLIQ